MGETVCDLEDSGAFYFDTMRWFIPWIKKEDIGNGLTWLIPTLWENQSTFCSPIIFPPTRPDQQIQSCRCFERKRWNWSWKRHRVAKPVTAEHRGWHDYESESKGWFQRPEMNLMNQSGKRNHMTTDIRKLIYRGKKKIQKGLTNYLQTKGNNLISVLPI